MISVSWIVYLKLELGCCWLPPGPRWLFWSIFCLQVSLAVASNLLGQVMVVPAGFLTSHYGVRPAFLVSMALVVSGFGLLWTSTFSTEFYKRHFGLICLYYFIACEASRLDWFLCRPDRFGKTCQGMDFLPLLLFFIICHYYYFFITA